MNIDEIRIGYILPGHQPEIDEAAAEEERDEDLQPSFSDRLRALDMPKVGDWKQVLGLTEETPSLTRIDAPPRPAGLKQNGLIHDDAEWRSFLSRYRTQPRLVGESLPVQHMMDLLTRFQQSTDMVRAKALAGERE